MGELRRHPSSIRQHLPDLQSTIKHDGDLLDWCVTCAFYLCARIPQANEIFCAVILRYSSILKLDEAAM